MRVTNKEYTKLDVFQMACKLAGVKPTTRQASKFRSKKDCKSTGWSWRIKAINNAAIVALS